MLARDEIQPVVGYNYWQMFQHVVNHGTHHRSEVAAMLTRIGHAPPPMDLIVHYRTTAGR